MADNSSSPAEQQLKLPTRTKQPKYTQLSQQELPAFRPLLTPNWVLITLFTIGIAFIPVGVICLAASRSVVELSARYDDQCLAGVSPTASNAVKDQALVQLGGNGENCTVSVMAMHAMKAPIFMYYELTNFHQNHRRYVSSRDDTQLRGKKGGDLSKCAPQLYEGGDPSKQSDPCGLVAWSYFNDTYAVFSIPDTVPAVVERLAVDESNIAWKTDRTKKFGSQLALNLNEDPATRGGGTITGPVNQDEHFIVWMRAAAMPTFRKLWGRINTDIAAGTQISIQVQNRYNSYRYGGKKSVVLSTTSWLGGRNDFLGIAYIALGSASFGCALLFAAALQRWPRKLGDVRLLSWNRAKLS